MKDKVLVHPLAEKTDVNEKRNLTQPNKPAESILERKIREHFEWIEEHIKQSGDLSHLYHPDGTRGGNGFGHSKNLPHHLEYWFNHMPHRSPSEVAFHKALLRKNKVIEINHGKEHTFIFWVLPTGIQRERERIELDFLILHHGQWIVVEIDGSSHLNKYFFDEEARLSNLRNNFLDVRRIRPNYLDPHWANTEVDLLFNYLELKRKAGK